MCVCELRGLCDSTITAVSVHPLAVSPCSQPEMCVCELRGLCDRTIAAVYVHPLVVSPRSQAESGVGGA